MRKQLAHIIVFILLFMPGAIRADEPYETEINTEDEKVIAVLEILELMEMVDDMPLLKDMEYLTEEDPNEPQK